MRRVVFAIVAACGSPKPVSPIADLGVNVVSVEWRTKPGDAGKVEVELRVDRNANALGTLDAETVATCAVRRADASGTELTCGGTSAPYFAAELAGEDLVVSLVDGRARREVKRIPLGPSIVLSVVPYGE